MSAGSLWGLRLVVLLVLLAGLVAPSDPSGRPTEAAPATPQLQPTVQPVPSRAAAPGAPQSQPTVPPGLVRAAAPAAPQFQPTVPPGPGRTATPATPQPQA